MASHARGAIVVIRPEVLHGLCPRARELVYRKQIRPVLQAGATVMDQIFVDPDA